MKAVIYARYSADKQKEESIEAQIRACEEYAAKNGLNVIGRYYDKEISGKQSKTDLRKEYNRMKKDAESGKFDVVLVHKFDRLARSLNEISNLTKNFYEKYDIRVISVTQDFGFRNESKIVYAIMWSMAEYYNDNLADETRKGLKEVALKGEHTGGYPPFGYDVVDKKYVINETEADYVRRMFNLCESGDGYNEIIAEMEKYGIKGKRGSAIKYPQIYEILRNEKYTGTYLYSPNQAKKRAERREKVDAIRIDNAFPAIIGKDQFERVQAIMTERRHSGRKNNYLCSGLVYCACGAKMHGMTSKRKGHEYKYFTCSASCGNAVARMEDVDEAAKNYLLELISNPENQKKISDSLVEYDKKDGEARKIYVESTKKRLAEKKKQKNNVINNMALIEWDAETLEEMKTKIAELNAEIAALEESAANPPADLTTTICYSWLDSIKKAAEADETGEYHDALHLLIERIDYKFDRETERTEFNISSTLNSVLGNIGCGGRI